MAKRVKVIPATLTRYSAEPMGEVRIKKVAGYARVSTDYEDQQTSYEAQMRYYEHFIQAKPEWSFAGMYSDEGISGTSTRQRNGFKKMIDDALAGKIDLIITKSISRFARNTVDCLATVRALKEKGIEVFFEKENIWTLDSKGELLITIMSSLAQEESRSISENVTWGMRKRFADGQVSVSYSTFLGYDKDFVINKEEAKVVRLIYKMYLSGYSTPKISARLMEMEIPAPGKGKTWHNATILGILQNEKYKGDALLQKSYTTDFLQKTSKKNEGEVPQYYVEQHHEPIVSPKVFELVQKRLARNRERDVRNSNDIFSKRIKCEICGGYYGPKIWHSNDKYRHIVYQSNNKYKIKGNTCQCMTLEPDMIKDFFMRGLQKIVRNKDEIVENLEMLVALVCGTEELAQEQAALENEIKPIAKALEDMVKENASVALDQELFAKQETSLQLLYKEKQERINEIKSTIVCRQVKRVSLQQALEEFKELKYDKLEFSERLWNALLDEIIVLEGNKVKVIFVGGIGVRI